MSTAQALNEFMLTMERRFAAPIEQVYDAWLSKQALEAWFSPSPEMAVRVDLIEPEVGGRYSIFMDDPDCDAHHVSGEYVSIDRPRQLVFTWSWDTAPEAISLVTLSFRAEGEATVMTLLHEKLPSQEARDQHEEGWVACIERLVTLVEAG